MPSLETARRINSVKYNGAKTIGQMHKENSDFAMEFTWNADIGSRKCYIYDYFHDDQPDICYGMTYENTTKYEIDAKFIVAKYGSIDKDQVEYHLQFKPSQKTTFQEGDELYYFEKNYRQKFGVIDAFVGMYIDIPDDAGVYRKWLICGKEIANQFPKYFILPITYRLMWIERSNSQIIKRKMWAVLRQQSS